MDNTTNTQFNSNAADFTLASDNTPALAGHLELINGESASAVLSLDCGIEAGFEVWNGKLRVLIYRKTDDEPEIIELGNVSEIA